MAKKVIKTDNIKGFSGFTLAEVLITLVIVGIIAAMTIPTLINKTNNQEYVSRLKKTYSTMAQATNRLFPMKACRELIWAAGQLLMKRYTICIKSTSATQKNVT